MNDHALDLSREEMREIGYRVIDLLIEHFQKLPDKPVTRKGDRLILEKQLREPIPAQGTKAMDLLDRLEKDVFSRIMHLDHPRFFAFVPSPGNFISVMADALASGFNVFAGTWLESSGPAQIELVVLDWLRQACGLPETAGGIFVSGGSMANITALAVARHIKLRGRMDRAVIYGSDQTHSSIERGLRVLGFQADQFQKIACDALFRLDLTALREAVAKDRAAEQIPFCVVANAGTTNTGAIDPLSEIAAFCRKENLWLHIDGAYGAAAVLCEKGKKLLKGLEQADSLTWDPHKWLFQPYEIGCVLVREEHWLRETFHILPEYLADAESKTGEVNFCDRGIQLTRGFRALKLWLSLEVFGKVAFEKALNHGFETAMRTEECIRKLPDWEVTTPAQMAIVTFRYAPAGSDEEEIDRLNHDLVRKMIADGFAMLSSTVLRGKTVLRMCTINPRTTEEDIQETVRRLDQLAREKH
jgi:glutamate/tyrosine decarboxylase-like PLP-dependent enzyme